MSLKMEYVPSAVSKLENGNRRIQFTTEEVIKGGQACSLQLYGYFVGTTMDYRVVRANLMKMWRVYDIEDITKTNSGIFYFKFKSEEGMKIVLESGPWMIQNVPLVLNVWEPGIWLEKTEPSTIPIWVCVYNIPMELCNGNAIGKIMSGVGKPMLMDRMTKDRCLKKAGKLDFARVLVEVSANDDLPNVLEIAYPPLGNREARVGKLEVKYQWKPPLCTHCRTFGHTTLSCKVRPRTDDERAAKIVKDASKLKDPIISSSNNMGPDDEGFVQVGRKNKPILAPTKSVSIKNDNGGQNRSSKGNANMNSAPKQSVKQVNSSFGYGKSGNQQRNFNEKQGKFQVKNRGNVGGTSMSTQAVEFHDKKLEAQSNNKPGMSKNNSKSATSNEKRNLQQLSKDPNFRPRVLVRGSSSNNETGDNRNEPIPVKNSFSALVDEVMVCGDSDKNKSNVDDFESIWPDLKSEVDILMEAGIYPSKSVRLDWTVHQMDYFYKNCHKYQLDPSYEDDDVESDIDGIATCMKPEFEVDAATEMENDAAQNEIVSNGV